MSKSFSSFRISFDQAKDGGVLIVSEIKRAYEAEVGHKVVKTTIYRMLDRHDWRKIMPRPPTSQERHQSPGGLKKNSRK